MRIDVHHHVHCDEPGVTAQLDTVLFILKALKAQGDRLETGVNKLVAALPVVTGIAVKPGEPVERP